MRSLPPLFVPLIFLGCSGSPVRVTQHEPWYTKGDPAKRPSATRRETTITLRPSEATFKVPEDWVEWHQKFGNNFHLTTKDLDAVARGDGEWDTEFASVCNTVLPFDRCSAQVGDDGWGKQSASFSDLQVRVYDLDDLPETVERRINADGAADVRRFSGIPELEQDQEASWRRTVLSYGRWYGDYGGRAHVDFRVRRFDSRTIVFVFMYTDYHEQAKTIASILGSFRVP